MTTVPMVLTALIPVTIATTFSFATGCLIFFRRSAPLRILFIYSLFHAATLLFILFAFYMHMNYGMWLVVNLFFLVEFVCLVTYLRGKVSSDASSRLLQLLQHLFPLFFLYSLLYTNSPARINPVLFLVHHLLIVVACFTYYHELLLHPPEYKLLRFPTFWVVGGIAISCLVCTTLGFLLFTSTSFDTHTVLLARTASGFALSSSLLIALKYQLQRK